MRWRWVDQLLNAVTQGERRTGDKHAEGRDQRPEMDFPPVPQRMLIVAGRLLRR
jgi:hypothetical protein